MSTFDHAEGGEVSVLEDTVVPAELAALAVVPVTYTVPPRPRATEESELDGAQQYDTDEAKVQYREPAPENVSTPEAHPSMKAEEPVTVSLPVVVTLLPVPDAGVADTYASLLSSAIHRLTNEERVKRGLPELRFDSALSRTAERHARDMARREYFAHASPSGCTLACRLEEDSYSARSFGENLAWYSGDDIGVEALAARFVREWLVSGSHEKNMFTEVMDREGIGVAQSGDTVYVVTDFSLPE